MARFKFVSLVILTTFIMGIAFPVGKIGMNYAPPFLLMAIRFLLAGGIMAVILARKHRPPGGKRLLQAAVIGLFQSAGVMGCAYYSMRWITSGESAIITCTNPLLVIVLGTLLTGAAYRSRQWLGVAVGFVGILVTFGLHLDFRAGTWISFAGAFCFAAATLLIKRWGPAFDMRVLAAYQMLAGGVALLVLSLITEHPYFVFTGTSVTVTLWLAAICSIIQFSLWFYLLRTGDPGRTSAFLFLVPIFGVLFSWLLLGEKVEWYVGLGGAIVCAGIFLVNWAGKAEANARIASRTSGANAAIPTKY